MRMEPYTIGLMSNGQVSTKCLTSVLAESCRHNISKVKRRCINFQEWSVASRLAVLIRL